MGPTEERLFKTEDRLIKLEVKLDTVELEYKKKVSALKSRLRERINREQKVKSLVDTIKLALQQVCSNEQFEDFSTDSYLGKN